MNNDDAGHEGESRRQRARQERRTAGERSASAARTLMELPEADVGRLGLDEELREVVDQARAVTSNVARRRAERHLAGQLRQADVDDVLSRIARLQEGGRGEARLFQQAESWRARLIEGTASAEDLCAGAPGMDRELLVKRVDDARRERATGKPRGAARALFRAVMAALGARQT